MDMPRLAVTTVLLYEQGSEGPDVLLVRRPSSMAAFGDMWVFPGGRVDASDADGMARAVLDAAGAAHAARPCLAPHDACPDPALVPLYTAACRELFEEVGVLFTTPHAPAGGPVQMDLLAQRPAILADGSHFFAELARRGLMLDVDRLVPWSRWITPPARGRRFDTIFFVAAVSERGLAPEPREIAEAQWLDLDAAIREGLGGSRPLMTPTVLTLMQIAAARRHYGSLSALLQSPATSLLAPVQPRGVDLDGRHWILLPWDEQAGEPGGTAWRTHGLGEEVPGRLRAEF